MKRNPYLRVKLKSLAAEAKIIRVEEKRAKDHGNYSLLNSLHDHRVKTVRNATRETLLAYQFLRGIPYEMCEGPKSKPVNWKNVGVMARRYGKKSDDELKTWQIGLPDKRTGGALV